jgi:hypothetical protein
MVYMFHMQLSVSGEFQCSGHSLTSQNDENVEKVYPVINKV